MSTRLETVIYRNPAADREYFVHRLSTPDINLYAARKVLELLEASLAFQLETPAFKGPDGVLPAGTMKERFARLRDANLQQMDRMNRSLNRGGAYWYINPEEDNPTDRSFYSSDEGYVAGLIKTSPSRVSRAQRLRLQAPNCYVNDIVVDPKAKSTTVAGAKQRIGSMLMHAALKFGDYQPRAKLTIDGYIGDEAANDWFGRLGLQQDPTVDLAGWAASDAITLAQVRFTSPPNCSIRNHVQALEGSAAWLGQARLVVTT